MLKKIWSSLRRIDNNLHNWLLLRFPKQLSIIDKISDQLFKIITNPAFALIITFLLVVLVVTNVVNIIIAISIGCAWLIAIVWISRSEFIRKVHLPIRLIFLIIIGFILAFGGSYFGNWTLTQYRQQGGIQEVFTRVKVKASASPSEITVVRRAYKDVIVSITNNEEHTIFDMCLSICVSNDALVPSAIRVVPLLREYIPNTPNLSGERLVLGNKCIALFFGGFVGLQPHTTKDYFRIVVDGEKVTKDMKVAFDLYHWSKEPSMFVIPKSVDEFPQNLNDLINGSGKIKPGMSFVQNIQAPISPYFPNEKTYTIIEMGYF